jgi:hypothetical protein
VWIFGVDLKIKRGFVHLVRNAGETPIRGGHQAAAGCNSTPSLVMRLHQATLAMVIVERTVMCGSVIPDCNRPLAPIETTGEFVPARVCIQVIKKRLRLIFAPARKLHRKIAVYI